MADAAPETPSARVERLVREFAQGIPASRPLDGKLSLKNDLAIESLSLVSLTLRLGDELGVDVVEMGLELGDVKTLSDLVQIADTISRSKQ
jgi:acyl carrier protein